MLPVQTRAEVRPMTSSATGFAPPIVEPGPAVHDFDFLHGRWRVRHRRLKQRLAGSDEWDTFEGTCHAWPILDGAGNVDDNVLELPERALPRRLDPLVRPRHRPLVDLVARWPQPGRPRPARPRRVRRARRRDVPRRGHVRRPADRRALPVDRHLTHDLPLGAGVLDRRRRDVGGELGDGEHTPRVRRRVSPLPRPA